MLLYALLACDQDYNSGIVWEKQRTNESTDHSCSDLHSYFQSGVYISRQCHHNRQWGSVDFSDCILRPNSTLLVMVEVNSSSNRREVSKLLLPINEEFTRVVDVV